MSNYMETFYDCVAKTATINQWTIGEVFDNWNSKEAEQIMNKAADYYAETRNSHKHSVMQGLPYYQLCPKCFGEGIVDNPYARGTSSTPTRPCPVCYGAKTFYHALSGSLTVGKEYSNDRSP